MQFIDISQLPLTVRQSQNYPDQKIEKLQKENNDLKKENNELKKENNVLKKENNDLKKEINELKNKKEKDFCVVFDKEGQAFYYPIICNKTDTFEIIEKKIYQKHPEFLDTTDRNIFKFRSKPISDKTKTLEELGIIYGDLIVLENE